MPLKLDKIHITNGTVGAVRIASGSSKTPLVYINGGPGGTFLDENHGISALSNDRDIILYDQLGSFHSPAPFDLSLTPMERFVDELQSVLDYYELEQAVLLGHSFGGSVAIDFCLTHPDRVDAVIFSSPLISTPLWLDDANYLLSKMPDREREIIEAELKHGNADPEEFKAAEKLFYQRHLCRLDPWPDRLLQSFEKSNGELYRAMWGISEFTCTGTLKNYDRFSDLKHLEMPVLLTCGRYDEFRPQTMERCAARIKNVTTAVFENSSHTPLLEEKDVYLASINRFLNGLS
jgi:proline iminopeptidase